MRLKLPVLLSARLGKIRRIVFRAHCYHMRRALVQKIRDIKRERCIATIVRSGQMPIDPNSSVVINCAKMQ
jgi:hypothetical protein